MVTDCRRSQSWWKGRIFQKKIKIVFCVCVFGGWEGSCKISQSVQMFKHRRDSVLVNVFAYLGCGRLWFKIVLNQKGGYPLMQVIKVSLKSYSLHLVCRRQRIALSSQRNHGKTNSKIQNYGVLRCYWVGAHWVYEDNSLNDAAELLRLARSLLERPHDCQRLMWSSLHEGKAYGLAMELLGELHSCWSGLQNWTALCHVPELPRASLWCAVLRGPQHHCFVQCERRKNERWQKQRRL